MEVAFFTESYPPTRDGVAHETSALARALGRLGHRVQVYAPQPSPDVPPSPSDPAISVTRLPSVPVPLYPEYRWAVLPFAGLLLARAARTADVIHLHTPGIVGSAGFLASRRYDRPLVGTFHTNVWAMRESFPKTLAVQWFFRAAHWYTLGTYWRCDVATAPTSEAREALLSGAKKPFKRPVEIVPNGIELERFHPDVPSPDWRARCGLPSVPLVTFLGRLTQDKGVHRFLDAVAEASARQEFGALVAGGGPEEVAVRRRIEEDPRLRPRTRYVGPVAEEEKAALLAQSDLFVLPSTSDTSSVALLEAMACGTACLASDVGGPKELIQDGATGRLAQVGVQGAFGRAIASLLDDPQERRRLAREGLAFVREHASIERTARRFISLYELVLSERRTA